MVTQIFSQFVILVAECILFRSVTQTVADEMSPNTVLARYTRKHPAARQLLARFYCNELPLVGPSRTAANGSSALPATFSPLQLLDLSQGKALFIIYASGTDYDCLKQTVQSGTFLLQLLHSSNSEISSKVQAISIRKQKYEGYRVTALCEHTHTQDKEKSKKCQWTSFFVIQMPHVFLGM